MLLQLMCGLQPKYENKGYYHSECDERHAKQRTETVIAAVAKMSLKAVD